MRNASLKSVSNLFWGALGLLLWWGLALEPASSSGRGDGFSLSFLGNELVLLDRAFFNNYGSTNAPLGWMLCPLLALCGAFLVYRLLNGLFRLDRHSARTRLILFGFTSLLILIDINPFLSRFLSQVPANLEVLALECGNALTCLTAFVAGLSAALIVSTLVPGINERLDALFTAVLNKPILPIVFCAVACALVVWVRNDSLQGLATVSDELSYLRQAEIFYSGELSERSHEPRAFFDSEQMLNDGRYYSKYPPGASICYSVGFWIGEFQYTPAAFLLLNLLLTWRLCRRLFDVRTAHLALLLASISPFFVCMGESFLSHGPGLFFCLLTFYFHVRWFESRGPWPALFSGMAGGFFLLIRPVSAVAVLAPLLVYSLFSNKKKIPARLVGLVLFGIGFSIFAGLLLAYNYEQTGDALLNPYDKYAAEYTPYDKFGPDNASQGAMNTLFNVSRLNRWLFGFAPSLLLVIPLFAVGAATAWEIVFVLALIALAGAYVFHWFWGIPWYGPLYYYECAGFCAILAARSLLLARERLSTSTASSHANLWLAGLAVLLFTTPNFFCRQIDSASHRIEKVWQPILELRQSPVEYGSWVVFDDEPPGFRATYIGAAPESMTMGIRVLTSHGGDIEALRLRNPDRIIYRYQNGKPTEVPFVRDEILDIENE